MLSRRTLAAGLILVIALAGASSAQARVPREFFGIAPQTTLFGADTERMRRGGIDVVRVPMPWPTVQPSPNGGYDWSAIDQTVATVSRSRLAILPVLGSTPRWLSRETNLPISGARQRQAWSAFVRSAVQRYGPRGQFWLEHAPGTSDFVPRNPIKRWQIWNEENFFYFTTPASPGRYARLLKISRQAVRQADRRAEIVIGGLFGHPKQGPPRAMDATDFLERLYRVPGVKQTFDGVALHPYAANVEVLSRLVNGIRDVIVRNRDRRTGLYITEMGWGSQHNPKVVAFEVGWRQQARELRLAYRFLIRNQRRLNLQQVHWFTWKDVKGDCEFCDSSGLFREGVRFRPKPAWRAFVAIAR